MIEHRGRNKLIGTITLNPAIDKRYFLEDFSLGDVHRTDNYLQTAGGKGINVARVVKILGEDVVATGFLGGNNGDYIRGCIREIDIVDRFTPIQMETRLCMAILTDGIQTEILESGPVISDEELSNFYLDYEKTLKDIDILTISGSIPSGVPKDIYAKLINKATLLGIRVMLDTSSESLIQGIKAKPYLIKPNLDELMQLFGRPIVNIDDIEWAGKKLMEEGIEVVVISMGDRGSMVFADENIYRVTTPKIKAVNPVGCGDSMLAGIAVGISRGYDLVEQIRLGTACGISNALEKKTGYVNEEIVKELCKTTVVKQVR